MRLILTKRLIFIALTGAFLVLLAGLGKPVWAVAAFVLVNLILACLILLDVVSSPSPQKLCAERRMETKLSLGSSNDVTVVVTNHSENALFLWVTDHVPVSFQHTLPVEGQWVPAHGSASFGYSVMPGKRGEFLFPAICIRFRGIYGMVEKQLRIPTEDRYKVYPNMKALTEYRLSALSRNMFLQGVKRLRRSSLGGEFDSLREYTFSDPYNTINWAATARRNELVVNTYVPERNQYVFVMLDASRVMNAEIHHIKKLDYAINAAFLLTDYCIRGGDNIGLMVFDSQVRRYLSPRNRDAQFEAIAENLYDVESTETAADYQSAIQLFAQKQRRRSLVFVFTELFNADEAVRFAEAVRAHLSHHLVYAITIQDPRLRDFAAMEMRTSEDLYLKAAGMKLLEERNKIRTVLESAGILNSDIDPDKLSLETVSRYLDIKRSGLL